MPSIYEAMKKDWNTYTLMAGIAFIEEMSKPTITMRSKNYKGKTSVYKCYHPVRLKMVDRAVVQKWFDVTKKWQENIGVKLLGEKEEILFEPESRQYFFYFSPNWLFQVLSIVKSLPSSSANSVSFERIRNYRKSRGKRIFNEKQIEEIQQSKSLFGSFFENMFLAAGAFVVSFDLEFRGAQCGGLNLCMSEKYRDFLEFMNAVAVHWGWSTNPKLKPVSVEYSRQIGINASNQFQFRIKSGSLAEIYDLAGPVINSKKDQCLRFHIQRVKNHKITGRPGETKQKLLTALANTGPTSTTELQFFANVGTDVVNEHLNDLFVQGLVIKERRGKRNIWELKDAGKCNL
jgi:hypothetical protein